VCRVVIGRFLVFGFILRCMLGAGFEMFEIMSLSANADNMFKLYKFNVLLIDSTI
jgi:hypothetical protein